MRRSDLTSLLATVGAGGLGRGGGAAGSPPEAEAGPDAPRVLLVEDEPEIRAFLRSVLKPYYRLLEATNGEEGLRAAPEGAAGSRSSRT